VITRFRSISDWSASRDVHTDTSGSPHPTCYVIIKSPSPGPFHATPRHNPLSTTYYERPAQAAPFAEPTNISSAPTHAFSQENKTHQILESPPVPLHCQPLLPLRRLLIVLPQLQLPLHPIPHQNPVQTTHSLRKSRVPRTRRDGEGPSGVLRAWWAVGAVLVRFAPP
jgi:hypothetical protein